jgi:hypothetical protein
VQDLLSFSLLSKNIKIKICRTKILPVVLCGCETQSLTMRKECTLRVFENRVLRRIFMPRKEKVRAKCSELHKEELNDLYSSPNIIRMIKLGRMGGACSRYGGESRGVYRVLVRKPEGKRPLGRPRHRWEDNIKMDLQEVGLGGMYWIDLAQDREGSGHL